jgi:hypothetical protein
MSSTGNAKAVGTERNQGLVRELTLTEKATRDDTRIEPRGNQEVSTGPRAGSLLSPHYEAAYLLSSICFAARRPLAMAPWTVPL